MKTFLECLPCMVRQTYEAVTFVTDEQKVQEDILRCSLDMLATISVEQTPPHMATQIHRMIKQKTGCSDPYLAIRERSNEEALKLYDSMKKMVGDSPKRLETAIRLSIAGNVIDFGAPSRPGFDKLPEIISAVSSCKLKGGYVYELIHKAKNSKQILILGDNAGEIVFDRILIEELGPWRCTYVVKGEPIINDCTFRDALQVGLTKVVNVIDNGSDAPGTIIEWCSDKFIDKFNSAEIVIAKGQGNYESLSSAPRSNVFFLLKAKCPVVARDIGCDVGDYAVSSTNSVAEQTK